MSDIRRRCGPGGSAGGRRGISTPRRWCFHGGQQQNELRRQLPDRISIHPAAGAAAAAAGARPSLISASVRGGSVPRGRKTTCARAVYAGSNTALHVSRFLEMPYVTSFHVSSSCALGTSSLSLQETIRIKDYDSATVIFFVVDNFCLP